MLPLYVNRKRLRPLDASAVIIMTADWVDSCYKDCPSWYLSTAAITAVADSLFSLTIASCGSPVIITSFLPQSNGCLFESFISICYMRSLGVAMVFCRFLYDGSIVAHFFQIKFLSKIIYFTTILYTLIFHIYIYIYRAPCFVDATVVLVMAGNETVEIWAQLPTWFCR